MSKVITNKYLSLKIRSPEHCLKLERWRGLPNVACLGIRGQRAFCVFCVFCRQGEMRGIQLVAICNPAAECH